MTNYNSRSMKAEEFICDEEIKNTLEDSALHKNDKALIEKILEKAAKYEGLDFKEAMVLLECEDPETVNRMFALAKEIKEHFYGNRIV
ncbi:MAG: [FeFe] hydrogenase H-cluster radical SAM maturase HydG, partial [Clostridiales bacterium]|nr:[FeFe] hydrogenase H-cluster radical SAM maturase HydG [Clostridiales bacterium]